MDYHSFYYDKRVDDFVGKVKKRHVKATICVDDQSQLIVSYSAYFGHIHDSKEFRKTLESMDKEIAGKFRSSLATRDMIQRKITLLPGSMAFWQ